MNILPNKSLDSILGTFTKTLAQLDSFLEGQAKRQVAIGDQLSALNTEAKAIEKEVERAKQASDNIKAIIKV